MCGLSLDLLQKKTALMVMQLPQSVFGIRSVVFGSRQQTAEARGVVLSRTSAGILLISCLGAVWAHSGGFIGAKIGVLVSLLRRQNKDNEATWSTPLQPLKTSFIHHKMRY